MKLDGFAPLAAAVVALFAPAMVSLLAEAPQPELPRAAPFKVATWNIRSGMGIRGFDTTSWTDSTTNCTDKTKPLNAWGVGLPQRVLHAIKADPTIVALALQEAWGCGSPSSVTQVLGFAAASREQEGTALLARHGFAAPVEYHQLDRKENRWLIGGPVCLDATCAQSIPIFSTHWGAEDSGSFPAQARAALHVLKGIATPHLFMGDLNMFKIDPWNPQAPCTSKDHPGRLSAIALIENAGYVDAWKATQRGEGWTGMSNRRGCGVPDGNRYKRIDYVYVRGLRVLGTSRFGAPPPGADAPSDHAGLLAELAVPAAAKQLIK